MSTYYVVPRFSTSSVLDDWYGTSPYNTITTASVYKIWVRQMTQTATTTIWTNWSNGYFDQERRQWEHEQRQPRYGELARVETVPPIDPEYVKRRAEEKRLALVAEERADELLIALLDPDQRRAYSTARYFDVVCKSGRRYRLMRQIAGGVLLLAPDGKVQAKYCAHLSGSIPVPDHLIAQKFMLEHHEEEFLRVANRS